MHEVRRKWHLALTQAWPIVHGCLAPDKDELKLLHEGVSAGCTATGYFYRLSVRLVENLMRESRTKRDPSQFICNADFA